MKIWVDADSCPVRIREIICKASKRINRPAVFTANRPIPLPQFNTVAMVVTGNTEQAADTYIIEHALPYDLAVTRDIPLAKQLVDKGVCVINDRGTHFTKDTINTFLSSRNFMYELHQNGIHPDRTGSFGKRDIQKFSHLLDSVLVTLLRNE